jgi:outer membrane immunogenic protein
VAKGKFDSKDSASSDRNFQCAAQRYHQQSFVGDTSHTVSGWLVGSGIEYAFSPNWSAKLEWDYLKLPGRTFTLTGAVFPALAGDTIISDHNVQMAKLGINYRFNWGGPVVARY